MIDRAAIDKSLETVSKGVKCPFSGCKGIIDTIEARATIRWQRLGEPGYGLPAGAWTFSFGEPSRYRLVCGAGHETVFTRDELPEDFRRFIHTGVKPYTPALKRKVH